jgi:flagellar basal-body rod protein FlgF
MINGMLEASKGCLKEEIRMDILSNNLANANVIGFKKDRLSFQQMLDQSTASNSDQVSKEGSSSDSLGVSIVVDMGEGDIQNTGNSLDLAITGEGFFKVNTPDGVRYTRKGNFTIDGDGNLVTQDGFTVIGKGGNINISGKNIVVDDKGEISVDGAQTGQLDLVTFDNLKDLIKLGEGLFKNDTDNPEVEIDGDTVIEQGYVELSNVNMTEEMVSMINCMRAFESYQKAMKILDDLNSKAINQVGSLR